MMDYEMRAMEELGRLHSEACDRMHKAESRARRLEALCAVWFSAAMLLLMALVAALTGCAPAADPYPGSGVCGIECPDPAYPVICEVERPEEVVWVCTEDGDACKAVPGLVCTP